VHGLCAQTQGPSGAGEVGCSSREAENEIKAKVESLHLLVFINEEPVRFELRLSPGAVSEPTAPGTH
jgi:hypothetical protein